VNDEYETYEEQETLPPPPRLWPKLLAALAFALLLYYPVGMIWVHRIDADPDFSATAEDAPPGASRAVEIAAALIDREVNINRWTANDPFFLPAAALDNMPNFQRGVVAAVSRFTIELTDQIARTRGSSEVDTDLDKALGLLKYPGTVWIFDLSTSWVPTASSEAQYRAALRSLRRYNARLAEGNAMFERRADNLIVVLDRIAADIGSSSASLDRQIRERGGLFDFTADDLFYGVKGRLYAYYLILRELAFDFEKVLANRDLAPAWGRMLESFRASVELEPWVVVNGPPDAALLPSHLAGQGFYLLRARTQLREISNILLK
jgi:hypothetical protein